MSNQDVAETFDIVWTGSRGWTDLPCAKGQLLPDHPSASTLTAATRTRARTEPVHAIEGPATRAWISPAKRSVIRRMAANGIEVVVIARVMHVGASTITRMVRRSRTGGH